MNDEIFHGDLENIRRFFCLNYSFKCLLYVLFLFNRLEQWIFQEMDLGDPIKRNQLFENGKYLGFSW